MTNTISFQSNQNLNKRQMLQDYEPIWVSIDDISYMERLRIRCLRIIHVLQYECQDLALLLRRYLLELRSFQYRIALLYKSPSGRYLQGVDPGPYYQYSQDGHPELNIHTHICTAYIKHFWSSHPWATVIDMELYRDAWVAGAEWTENNVYKKSQPEWVPLIPSDLKENE